MEEELIIDGKVVILSDEPMDPNKTGIVEPYDYTTEDTVPINIDKIKAALEDTLYDMKPIGETNE